MLGSFVPLVWAMQPTHAHLTPSFGASVSTEELHGSSLQVVTMIGEKLTEAVAEPWAAITTASYNTYGPAENAVVSTLRKFTGRSRDKAKAANVGLPMAPVTAYVVDASDAQLLVPRYAVGELALGGRQVARGYLDDVGKTSSQFVWSEAAGERIYRTGDLVRRVDHGIEFLGRNDDLVKLSGIRVELSEISAMCARADDALIEHVETLLLARPERPDVRVVVSFVSLRASQDSTEDGKTRVRALVKKQARENLPSYMVPGRIVVMGSMPRTASAKVDRNALKAVYLAIDDVDTQESESNPDVLEAWAPARHALLPWLHRWSA
ncbi:hypothetical protein L7F22_026818 [Adiantum nelumboides]|nr:hypothetical protein [Adiantum nelumboides]